MTKLPELIVAVGASAGGLAALQEFFSKLPPESANLAFVVIQHLAPDHKSLMQELLARHSTLPVRVAQNRDELRAGCVYLIPPATFLTYKQGRLQVSARGGQPHVPFDHFLHSLASGVGDRAVCIILSGTGNDGARGLLSIKEVGGLVMAQDESSAEYAGMPEAAIETGGVDLVLPPGQLAGELIRYAQARLVHGKHPGPEGPAGVLAALLAKTGLDFSEYKKETLIRRIHRRMAVRQVRSLLDYEELVRSDAHEGKLLLRDILIGVTRFFRDPDAFQALAAQITILLESHAAGETLRVWVPGCSTGEEAYSLVILLLEGAAAQGRSLDLKVFATDLDREALLTASQGCYPETISQEVSAARLQRYFVPRARGGYQVAGNVRDSIVFSTHNLVQDPPFTGLHLVSCRNLLIYFESSLQKLALAYLHFALKPSGLLLLGTSETTGERNDDFRCLDPKAKIYQKLGISTGRYRWPTHTGPRPPKLEPGREPAQAVDLGYRCLLEEYCPPAILVDHSGELLHVLVQADDYLKIPRGAVRLDLASLLPPRLGALASSAVHRLLRSPAHSDAGRELVVQEEGASQATGIKVRPLGEHQDSRRYALITFRDIEPGAEATARSGTEGEAQLESLQQILQLRQELQLARANFQTTVEELESANEELAANNEELLAASQEFETTSDQLRQDLARANEELCTLTSEHQGRVLELTELNDDMLNFLNSTRQAVLFLDDQLNVRRSSPSVATYVHVLERDVGRPVEHLRRKFRDDRFLEDAGQVVREGITIERDLGSRDELEQFRMSLHPYPCGPNRRGVVVTFTDTTRATEMGHVRGILEALDDAVTLVGREGRIERMNEAWASLNPHSGLGESLPALLRSWGQTAAEGLCEALASGVEQESWVYDRALEGETRRYRMTARRVPESPAAVLVIHRDITAGA